MAGGLLNLIAIGNQNVYLTGDPDKSFFKTTYSKYTNFGLQKFRIDYEGQRVLRLNEDSKFTFRIPRYGDLLMDTYLVVNIPTIWSPIYPPQDCSSSWIPYEFKWIENLGAQMIKEVEISVGGEILQKFSGQYLLNKVNRDFNEEQKNKFNKMSGNTKYYNDPGNYGSRVNTYPNAYYLSNSAGAEPSIRGGNIYIPLSTWFSMSSYLAFPLVSLQYNELHITITLRPVRELFQIRDVLDQDNNYPYIQPNFNVSEHQLYRFLQTPPNKELVYADKRTNWNADVHLMSTYGFLSEEEVRYFANNKQSYLIKEIYEYDYKNVTGTKKIELKSLGMVSNWMIIFQRDDVYLRNEWSNYTNWPYNYLPADIYPPIIQNGIPLDFPNPCATTSGTNPFLNPSINPDLTSSGLFITGVFSVENQKDILLNMGILLNGEYRENILDNGIYKYIENYQNTSGNAIDGVYFYNFGLNTDYYSSLQPDGAINMSKFTNIELEFTTYQPPLDPSAQFYTICDPSSGLPIGVNKTNWNIYDYNYNLTVFEERYNIVTFMSGNCGLNYAR